MINKILRDLNDQNNIIYIDNIQMYCEKMKKYHHLVMEIFRYLDE
jgi:hypothetical protein